MELTAEQARLFDAAFEYSASDIHLVIGEPPVFRFRGELIREKDAELLTAEALESLLLPLFPAHHRALFEAGTIPVAETVVSYKSFQLHICVYRSEGNLTSAIRVLLSEIPDISVVGGDCVELFREFAQLKHGLLLITGPVGSGKHTTAFAVLREIAQTRPCRIHMIKESMDYSLKGRLGVVSSLIVGQDAPDYESAAQLIFRGADPDVVFFADLPTIETARIALTLARTGHFVIASATAQSAAEAITTLGSAAPDTFPELLAQHLIAVTNQRLLVRANGKGRVPAYELLRNTSEVQKLLRAGVDTATLTQIQESDNTEGMRSLRQALDILVVGGAITPEAAEASL